MSKFFILMGDFQKGDVFLEDSKVPSAYHMKYNLGINIKKPKSPGRLFYRYKTHRKTDYLAGLFSFPIVSKQFKIILENIRDPMEFHPVKVICTRTNEVDDNYFFLNILENIECFDWEKSEYEKVPGVQVIMSIKKLALLNEKLKGRNIARMEEYSSLILVSEILRDQIEENNLNGIRFTSIEEYEDW